MHVALNDLRPLFPLGGRMSAVYEREVWWHSVPAVMKFGKPLR